jgi:Spy/CpxP family protein refolding chaperone
METTQTTQTTKTKRFGWRRTLLFLAAPALLGVGFCAARAQADDMLGMGPGMGRGISGEVRKAFMMRKLDRMLDSIKANESQRSAIQAIAQRTFAELGSVHDQHQRLRDQLVAALTADPVDRGAVENLRGQLVKMVDQGSQAISKGLLDAAQVLTPEQRQAAVKLAREHHGRRFR